MGARCTHCYAVVDRAGVGMMAVSPMVDTTVTCTSSGPSTPSATHLICTRHAKGKGGAGGEAAIIASTAAAEVALAPTEDDSGVAASVGSAATVVGVASDLCCAVSRRNIDEWANYQRHGQVS